MKKVLKKEMIIGIIIGIVIASSIAVYAINASSITYNETTVDGALDDLYTKVSASSQYVIPKFHLESRIR